MKPKLRPSPRLWNRPTGTASRRPQFSRSATKLSSTRSASMGLPKPKDITSCRRARSSSPDQTIGPRVLRPWAFLWPSFSARVTEPKSRNEVLRNCQRDVLTLGVAARGRTDRDRVDAGRRSAYRNRLVRGTARRLQHQQAEKGTDHEHPQDTPPPAAASGSHPQQRQSRHRQPDRIEMPRHKLPTGVTMGRAVVVILSVEDPGPCSVTDGFVKLHAAPGGKPVQAARHSSRRWDEG